MTDNEIIKALGQCETQKTCSDCPYFEKIGCKKHLYQDAYTLINRLKEKIEKLLYRNARLDVENNELQLEIKSCNAEIERLNALVKTKNKLTEGLDQSISYAYDRAIKEFAERLKNKIITECNPYGKPTFDYDTSISIMRYIDNLVKEMVGEEK